jgi:hypothetical protein
MKKTLKRELKVFETVDSEADVLSTPWCVNQYVLWLGTRFKVIHLVFLVDSTLVNVCTSCALGCNKFMRSIRADFDGSRFAGEYSF